MLDGLGQEVDVDRMAFSDSLPVSPKLRRGTVATPAKARETSELTENSDAAEDALLECGLLHAGSGSQLSGWIKPNESEPERLNVATGSAVHRLRALQGQPALNVLKRLGGEVVEISG